MERAILTVRQFEIFYMSWILGFIGRRGLTSGKVAKLCSARLQPLYTIERDAFYLATGGIAQTCLHGSFRETPEKNFNGWVVVGLGIVTNSENHKFLSSDDWQTLLSPSNPELTHINGHFVAIKWKPGQIQCFTDRLGLRTLFMVETDDGCAFSTRLDWLAQLKNGCKIDFSAFGAHWLIFNQLSYDSFVQGIKRLGPGGVAVCTPTSTQLGHKPYTPDHFGNSRHSFDAVLQPFLRSHNENDDEISLGLSGGLDSRTILALLASKRHLPFALHVFGHPDHPDVSISKQIAQREGFSFKHFNDPVPQVNVCWNMLQEYVGQTCVIGPASTILQTRYYPELFAEKKVVIDGGFGEIARRQFFNRILKRGRKALKSGNPALIYPLLQVSRAAIFNEDVLNIMRKGTEKQIESAWREMPALDDIGKENFLDILAIRTRLPNYYGFEQSRLDGEVVNYMPFAQPSFLQYVFDIPVDMRRNGRLYRQIIQQYYPSLAKYPLAKDNTTYPFLLATVPAWLWTKFKSKLGLQFADPALPDFLDRVSELVQDIAHSIEVKSYPAYDHRAIVTMVENFLAGKIEFAQQVDWWLSFEVWRRSIKANTA
jgi:hypothetical protein